MDAGTWRGIFTAVMLLLFVGICLWAWSGRRRGDFAEAARLPLDEGAGPAVSETRAPVNVAPPAGFSETERPAPGDAS